MRQSYLGLVLLLCLASRSSATDTVVHKIHLSDGGTFIERYTYLTSEESAKALADGVIQRIPKEGRLKAAYEAQLLGPDGKSLAKRRYDHKPPKPDYGGKPVQYECVQGAVKDNHVYMLLRDDYGYSDGYCFQVHPFENGVLLTPSVYTQIFMERASRGPSCKKIELLSYDVRGNIEVLIHPRVGDDLTPYRKKFGPNGDPSNDRIK